MDVSIRFFVKKLKGEEALVALIKTAVCDRRIEDNYVQFSCRDVFLLTQTVTYLPADLLEELNKKATRVSLLVSGVKPSLMVRALEIRNPFHMELGDLKVSGENWVGGDYKLLFSSGSLYKAVGAFKSFVPGVFKTNPVEILEILKGMTFFQKFKILFSF